MTLRLFRNCSKQTHLVNSLIYKIGLNVMNQLVAAKNNEYQWGTYGYTPATRVVENKATARHELLNIAYL